MTLRRLQHHRSRVPAIPPKVGPVTQPFTFDRYSPFAFAAEDSQWQSFLITCGLNRRLTWSQWVDLNSNSKGALRDVLTQNGIQLHTKHSPSGQSIFTVTRPARISPKLLATFPWKLRRLIKS